MRTRNFILQLAGVTLVAAGAMSDQAQEGYYDPTNVASPNGKTVGYELFKTIGCPGQQLFGSPCKDVPAKDSDGDGVTDDKDKCPGTPKGTRVDHTGCPLQEVTILKGVHFDFDKSTLRPDSKIILDDAAAVMQRYPDIKVEIAGHTDSVGTDEYNMGLSARRAQAVMDYFASKGIDASRLSFKGYGESMPIVDNSTASNRAQNRRVEMRIIK